MKEPLMVDTFFANRRLLIGTSYRETHEMVPEAVTWPMRPRLIHSNRLQPGVVSLDEFVAAVQEKCPELAEAIYDATGISEEALAGVGAETREQRKQRVADEAIRAEADEAAKIARAKAAEAKKAEAAAKKAAEAARAGQ